MQKSKTFAELYAAVDQSTTEALLAFRKKYRFKNTEIDATSWSYISCGKGEEAIILLHGMGGSADIWWQQILSLQDSYIILAPSYPAMVGIDNMAHGISAIMEHECIIINIPAMIIESDNDPLVEQQLRELLKKTYPGARVATFHNTGHFTYLNRPEEYTETIHGFLKQA